MRASKHAACFMEAMIARIAFALICLFASQCPAQADPPYFSEHQGIDLPEGQRGELRLLHDGPIFFEGPVYAVVVNQENRLVARSERSEYLSISCRDKCRAFDLRRGIVIEPEPATFRSGPILVPEDQDRMANDIHNWHREFGRNVIWGFSTRPMSTGDRFEGEFAYAKGHSGALIVSAVLSAIATLILCLGLSRPPAGSRQSPLWIVFTITILLAASSCLLLSLFVRGFENLWPLSWLAFTLAGIILAVAMAWLRRRRAKNLTPSSPALAV